ncbi:MAG: rRNA maturation RNase YbeY [Candidatus Pacebacteria bacterium]|nr:rRNA maturation RNase YbeY [Candidatus Paceibacterota bacterium]
MIEVNNSAKGYGDIKAAFLKSTAKKFLSEQKIPNGVDLSIALVDPDEIKKLNKKYRGENKPTDVLSFGRIGRSLKKEADFSVPEVVICPEEVMKNSEKGKEPFKKELSRVLVHGLLHLLGFDHEKNKKGAEEMFAEQENFLSQLRF